MLGEGRRGCGEKERGEQIVERQRGEGKMSP